MSVNITRDNIGNDGGDIQALSIGLDRLDEFFTDDGIRSGSMVNVVSQPDSLGSYVVANMIAQRPAYYYTLGRSKKHIINNIENVPNVNLDSLSIQVPTQQNSLDSIKTSIKNTDFPRGITLIIDPANTLEDEPHDEYRNLLRIVQQKMRESNGLAGIHSVETSHEPENRWLTQYMCDTVLGVTTERQEEVMKNFLELRKVYPGQKTKHDYFRRFELKNALNTDVTSTRNISP